MFHLLRSTVIGFLILGLACTAHAAVNRIAEEDGSPSLYPYEVKFPNGSITNNGDGTASIDTSAQQQTITVAKAGGDYTTIQAAINAITDNASGKPYTILVYPGIYTEDIVMEDYVSLQGVGDPATIVIYGTNSAPLVTGSAENAYEGIFGLTLSLAPTSNAQSVISNSAGTLVLQNCNIFIASSTADIVATAWTQTGGACWMNSCYFKYDMDGTHANGKVHSLITVSGSSSYILRRCEIDVDVDDENDTVIFLNESTDNTIESDIQSNAIHINLNSGSYSGIAGGFYLHGSGTNKFMQNNHYHMESAGNGTAYGIYVDSTTVAATIWSTANQIHIEGFANNYGLNVAAGDTFKSHFDDVVADGGNTGAGTVIAVQSPADGSFLATGAVDFGAGTLEIPNAEDPDVGAAGEISNDTDGANETGDVIIRAYDGSNQFPVGQKLKTMTVTLISPDTIDAADLIPIWFNNTGMTFTITEVHAWSDDDDVNLEIEELTDKADFTARTLCDTVVIETDDTGVYSDAAHSPSDHAAIEHDHALAIDFDTNDTPDYVTITITGWYNADVD